MLQTPVWPKPTSGKAQVQAIVQSIAKQVVSEPFEIAKSATEQVLGGVPEKKEVLGTQGLALQGYEGQNDAKMQRREARHLQAFREELKEIKKLQEQRAKGIEQRKEQAEQEKQQREEQKAQEEVPVEAPGKAKKGGMMQGAKKKVSNMLESFKFKKSRGVETQKMPSN